MAVSEALLFRDLAYVFAAALLGGVLAHAARQPLILGYVVGGIVIGPFTPGPTVSDVHAFELLAEVGVILLMFSIGIEFSLRDLLAVKWVAILGAPLGILLSMRLGVGAGQLIGWSVVQGVVIGAVVSVASTMVLARRLMDRGELSSAHGPGVMARVARTGSEELFLMVALAIALGTAAVTPAAGLSLALGAFLGGLIISQSDHAHAALARLLPVRDAFVALFFVTVGTLIDPGAMVGNPGLLVTLIALIVLGKFVIWTAVVRVFAYPLTTAALVGVGLTQIGEFSFILVQVARTAGLIGDDVYNATLAASLLTILVNAVLVRWVPAWLQAGSRRRPAAG